MVPLFDARLQNRALDEELNSAFARVFQSGRYIFGGELEQFEAEFAKQIGVRHAIGLSSGTDALLVALMALDLEPGDEVICPSFTFFATAGSIVRAGGKPVFADVLPDRFNIDPADAERIVTSRTRAIIPVHLYGRMADMDAMAGLAETHGLAVIEDAAQATGATWRGRSAGSIGTFGAFSFFPTKNLGALGDGGMLATDDEWLAKKAGILRNHGMEPKYYHERIGGNFRLDALQAAFLRVKLPHLDTYIEQRRRNAAFYLEALKDCNDIVLPKAEEGTGDGKRGTGIRRQETGDVSSGKPETENDEGSTWNQFTIRIESGDGSAKRRDELRQFLADRKIGSEIYYPVPLHLQPCLRQYGEGEGSLPITERIVNECLSLPIYPELTEEQLAAVADAIVSY